MRVNDIIARIIVSALSTVVLLIPFWIWLGAWLLMTPEGFWQKMVLVGFGAWFLGGLQVILLGVLIGVLIMIWDS